MKKCIYLILVLLALVSFTACSGANADKNLNESETDSPIVVTENSPETKKKEKVYYHAALQGAVIVATDGNKVSYQRKCDACGSLKPGKTTVYRNNGTYSSSFVCDKCKYQQPIKIQTTSSFQ